MKIKVSEATNTQLDWLVAKCEGFTRLTISGVRWSEPAPLGFYEEHPDGDFHPSANWAQGGPISEREWIRSQGYSDRTGWYAYKEGVSGGGPTELIAKMRCYVASKLDTEVEVPDELA